MRKMSRQATRLVPNGYVRVSLPSERDIMSIFMLQDPLRAWSGDLDYALLELMFLEGRMGYERPTCYFCPSHCTILCFILAEVL